jgi:hypothetical protein
MEIDLDHEQSGEMLAELKTINKSLKKQNSFLHIFWTGIVYGIGFIVGSAILATIILGLFGPLIGQIPWIRDAFVNGVQLIHQAK